MRLFAFMDTGLCRDGVDGLFDTGMRRCGDAVAEGELDIKRSSNPTSIWNSFTESEDLNLFE